MSKQSLIMSNPAMRSKASNLCHVVPEGTVVEFAGDTRSKAQNRRMWGMLNDMSKHGEIDGQKYTKDQWKAIVMQACGYEVEMLPSLTGQGAFPALSTSSLSVKEMTVLQDFIQAWGDQNGVQFKQDQGMY